MRLHDFILSRKSHSETKHICQGNAYDTAKSSFSVFVFFAKTSFDGRRLKTKKKETNKGNFLVKRLHGLFSCENSTKSNPELKNLKEMDL
jgi:hypothetical protein